MLSLVMARRFFWEANARAYFFGTPRLDGTSALMRKTPNAESTACRKMEITLRPIDANVVCLGTLKNGIYKARAL
jgi:hypothetical protein